MRMLNIPELEKNIGYVFLNQGLLIEAMTHPSYMDKKTDYSFLAFLGSEAVRLFLTKELVAQRSDTLEIISRKRDNQPALLELASLFNIEKHLYIGKGVTIDSGTAAEKILISAVAALIGAIFSDGSYAALEKFGKQFLIPRIAKSDVIKDPKTLLQEEMKRRGVIAPIYRLLEERGPDHQKIFRVAVCAGNSILAQGQGLTKKDAEKDAAQKAFSCYKK